MLPAGATVLPPIGTAPGAALEHDGAVVVVLPGPPWELAEMWEAARGGPPLAALLARAGAPAERVLRAFAVPESRVVAALGPLDPDAWDRLTRGDLRQGRRAGDHRPERARGRVGRRRARGPPARRARRLRSTAGTGRRWTRSWRGCSSPRGRPWPWPSRAREGAWAPGSPRGPGPPRTCSAGVISYSDPVKRDVLGVDPGLLRRHGAVSAPVAERMAAGARELVGSDWALSITGIAGPGGGTPEKPVGLVYVGLAGPDGVAAREHRLRGDREAIRQRSVAMALHALRIALEARGRV